MSLVRPKTHRTVAITLALVAFSGRGARADVGDGADALPSVVRVPVASPGPGSLGVAASAGYGWTESILHQGDAYSRAAGTIAASFQPTSYFGAALRFDGRYDTDTGSQSASGFVGDPRLLVRFNAPVGGAFRLGGQLGLWSPGGSAPSVVPAALTPDASVLASYLDPDSRWSFAGRAGFRWDNSSKSVTDPTRLSLPDKVELGLNQASAVLIGVGTVYHATPRLELAGEVTWDLLVGSTAPSAIQSPLLGTLGARYAVDTDGKLAVAASLTADLGGRPTVSATAPLVDIEPRVSAMFSLVVRPFAHRAEAAVAPPVVTAPPPPQQQAVQVVVLPGKVAGHVLAADGHAPLAHAHVLITVGATPTTKEAVTDDSGAYAMDGLPLGDATLSVTAEGFTALTRPVTVTATPAPLDLAVEKALAPSEIRGMVRDFAGKPVAASIHVEPGGRDVVAGRDGSFRADTEPGTYTVVIHATGYQDQTRKVVVERNGVTLLNVELRKQAK